MPVQEQSITRPQSKVGTGIVFAASATALLFFVPALLWPMMFAAGAALIVVAVRNATLPRGWRRAFAGVGALLIVGALVLVLDLASGGVAVA